jgi:hypothetical protein
MAAGSPNPIVPRPPEVTMLLGRENLKYRAESIWFCPTSVTRMASLLVASDTLRAPGNGGTEQYGENVALSPLDFEAVGKFAIDNGVTMVVVGNEDPLVEDIYDKMTQYEESVKAQPKEQAKADGPNLDFLYGDES